MDRRSMLLTCTMGMIALSTCAVFGGDEHEEQQALIKPIPNTKVTLQQGFPSNSLDITIELSTLLSGSTFDSTFQNPIDEGAQPWKMDPAL
jgi:hypothetical protein